MSDPIINTNLASPAPRAAAAGVGTREEAAQAWRREMERAQMEAWLAHGAVGFAGPKPAMPGWSPQPAAAQVTASAVAVPSGAGRAHAVAPASARAPADHQALHSAQRASAPVTARDEVAEASFAQDSAPPSSKFDMPPGEASASTAPSGSSQAVLGPEATAQMVSALQGLGPFVATTTVSGQAATPGVESEGVPVRPAAEAIAPKPEGPYPTLRAATATTAIADASSMAPPSGLGASQSGRERSGAMPLVPVQSGAPARAAAVAHEPIRLHADWSAEGVRLWLGMDAPVAGTLQSITLQLQRWLSAQGVRLLSISCNGRVVLEEPEPAAVDIYQADIHSGEPKPVAYPHHKKESS